MISKTKTTNTSDLLDFEACLLNELETTNRTGFYSLYKKYSSIHNENFKLLEKQYETIAEQSGLRFGKDTSFTKTYNYIIAFFRFISPKIYYFILKF